MGMVWSWEGTIPTTMVWVWYGMGMVWCVVAIVSAQNIPSTDYATPATVWFAISRLELPFPNVTATFRSLVW